MAAAEFRALGDYLGSQILGQGPLIEGLLIALLCEGHVLIEGAPGLAKTRAVKALAGAVEGRFARIQFTPDLLPADLTGSEVFHPQDASFVFQPGPLFNHLVLADEINRAPAKVQSALLEAMAEHQITVGKKSWRLPPLFMVAATQNPIEQEGTYPLPEAQLDRFLLKLLVDYPSPAMELAILQLNARGEQLTPPPVTSVIASSVSSPERSSSMIYVSGVIRKAGFLGLADDTSRACNNLFAVRLKCVKGMSLRLDSVVFWQGLVT